jgi:hypothetical protein
MQDMDFPTYVPPEVQAHAEAILRFCEGPQAEADSAACLQRLIWDRRMAEAYKILAYAFFADDDERRQRKIDILITAAWAARADFSKYRKKLKEATDLNKDIARTAAVLARLIRQFRETRVFGPMEFDSIADLLRVTDHHNPYSVDAAKWEVLGHLVCGDEPWDGSEEDQVQENGRRSITPEVVLNLRLDAGEQTQTDSATRMRHAVGDAWSAAPDVPALLDALGRVARDFQPEELGAVGAALASRQNSVKQAYLRAFLYLLTEQGHIALFADSAKGGLLLAVRKAIRIMADVAVNSPDAVFSDGDVSAAVENLPAENSRQE